MPNEKRAALYCRVARADNDAIMQQEAVLRDYAANNGYDNISVYADNGESGLNFDRPALSRLEADIEAGVISTVIVRSLCRIGRDIFKTEDWIVNIRRKGVSFISVTDGLNDSHFDDIVPIVRGFLETQKKS